MISGLVNDGTMSYDDKPSKYLDWYVYVYVHMYVYMYVYMHLTPNSDLSAAMPTAHAWNRTAFN